MPVVEVEYRQPGSLVTGEAATFRGSHNLAGLMVTLFENSYYSYGITLSQRWDRKVVITLNARNDHDR